MFLENQSALLDHQQSEDNSQHKSASALRTFVELDGLEHRGGLAHRGLLGHVFLGLRVWLLSQLRFSHAQSYLCPTVVQGNPMLIRCPITD